MPDWIFWAAGSAVVTIAFGAIFAIVCILEGCPVGGFIIVEFSSAAASSSASARPAIFRGIFFAGFRIERMRLD